MALWCLARDSVVERMQLALASSRLGRKERTRGKPRVLLPRTATMRGMTRTKPMIARLIRRLILTQLIRMQAPRGLEVRLGSLSANA